MLASRLLRGAEVVQNYAEDVFSAYTYTGNGATQTINNGIDLAGKGGMVWTKTRVDTAGVGGTNIYHHLVDSGRGIGNWLVINTNDAQQSASYIDAFNSNGYHIQGGRSELNANTNTFVSWTFRKAPKFFDCGTFVAGSATNRRISHALGIAPGMVVLKRTDSTDNWSTYHRSLGISSTLALNTTAAAGSTPNWWGATGPTATDFGVNEAQLCTSGGTYVWYAFAHDTGTSGLIQCGSFTTDGSGSATVSLGWEPQYLMLKGSGASAYAQPWYIFDSSRGFALTEQNLLANSSAAEASSYVSGLQLNASGFTGGIGVLERSKTYVYLAIRRPNKPPMLGTQVYNAIARTGTGAAATVTGVGFAPDFLLSTNLQATTSHSVYDRLRGLLPMLYTQTHAAEYTASADSLTAFTPNGVSFGADTGNFGVNTNTVSYIHHFFKRAPGVFDQVCYTGIGVAKTEAHNLGVVPELMIVKGRNLADSWSVYNAPRGNTKYLSLQANYADGTDSRFWNNTTPTASVFTVGIESSVNASGYTYVAYLFATKAGISKVGSYTGNGTSQTIPCGFTTGARFVLIKRTDSTGDWYVWDTARGIVAGTDPHLSLNTTAAEVPTDDSIDPDTSGFIVNQLAATNINVTSATYIFLAFA